jgi:hypothetical protein
MGKREEQLKEAFMAGAEFGRNDDSDTFWDEVKAEEAAYVEWRKTYG